MLPIPYRHVAMANGCGTRASGRFVRGRAAPPTVLDAQHVDHPGLTSCEHHAAREHPILPTARDEVTFECDQVAGGAVASDQFADDRRTFALFDLERLRAPIEAGDPGSVGPDGEEGECTVVDAVADVQGRQFSSHIVSSD